MKIHLVPEADWGDVIRITGFFYRIDLGPGAKGCRFHYVHAGRCSCPLGEDCLAVKLVQSSLAAGDQAAPNPPDGCYSVLPPRCPICGSAIRHEARLNSPVRGLGWQCQAVKGHYWQSLGREKAAACTRQTADPVSLAPEAAFA